MSLLGRAHRVVCNSLEFMQALPLNVLPSFLVSLALSNNRMSELANSSFSGLALLERPPLSLLPCWCLWSVLLPQTMLMPIVHVDVCGLLLLEVVLASKIYAANGEHVDVCGPHCHQRLCWCLWSVLSPDSKMMPVVLGGES